MFKKIQKYLLINYPLLWNTKIVPAITIALLFHILFFIIGYGNGFIDFTSENQYESTISNGVIIFFSILVTILFFVIWFVYYFRNNAYKSYYNLKKSSLYKEWLIILLISFFNVTYSVSYITGKTVRERSYYTQKETQKRCETISMASVFIEGSYLSYAINGADSLGQITFNKKRYFQNSLINKSLESFELSPTFKTEMKVKTWMQENNQTEIKKLMSDYFALVKEHKLKSNIDAEKWFALTYNFPDFKKYERIGRTSLNYSSNNYENNLPITVAEQTVYKYNVPQNALVSSYYKISKSWEDPILEIGLIYTLLYLSISIAMLIFSFKVTSGRNWLIALISSTGVLFIITGILSALSGSGITFLVFWLLAILFFIFYFFVTVLKNKGKNISGISLNLMLWSLAGFLPIIYGLIMEFYNHPKTIRIGNKTKFINTPEYEWLDNQISILTWVNMLIVMVIMYFIAQYIKKWKGLAES